MFQKNPPLRFKGLRWRKEKEKVWRRDNGRCVFCGTTNSLTAAHIIRRSQGGWDTHDNIITACVPCHNSFDQYKIGLPEEVWKRMDIAHREEYERTRRNMR